jgi:hypothetical protein
MLKPIVRPSWQQTFTINSTRPIQMKREMDKNKRNNGSNGEDDNRNHATFEVIQIPTCL